MLDAELKNELVKVAVKCEPRRCATRATKQRWLQQVAAMEACQGHPHALKLYYAQYLTAEDGLDEQAGVGTLVLEQASGVQATGYEASTRRPCIALTWLS